MLVFLRQRTIFYFLRKWANYLIKILLLKKIVKLSIYCLDLIVQLLLAVGIRFK